MKLQFGCGPRFERYAGDGDEMAKLGASRSVVPLLGNGIASIA
jgi:hypothetical protein